jgi:hypothetical protein
MTPYERASNMFPAHAHFVPMVERGIEDAIQEYRTRYEAAIRERDCANLRAEDAMKKLSAADLRNGELRKQLCTAQEVINKHVADQVEGLHCVDCVAEEDEICDCPMLTPIFEAMKGYTDKQEPRDP